jgi:pseudaminic acid cytidylyltransferase
MKKIAIIPARGGSKRIPRKNIKSFLGKPIIAYSIEAALKSGLFDEVMVSTDDEEIAQVSRQFGASVPFLRSEQNSNDFATTVDVLVEVIAEYRNRGVAFDIGCCIYPTAPLVKVEKLIEAGKLLVEKEYSSVFPVVKFCYPIWRSLKIDDGKVSMNWPEYLNSRSQDLPAAYHDAGQFYWFIVSSLLANKAVFTSDSGTVILDELQVQDIDTVEDWQIAELKFQLMGIDIPNDKK